MVLVTILHALACGAQFVGLLYCVPARVRAQARDATEHVVWRLALVLPSSLVAPALALFWLSSPAAAEVNGQVFIVYGPRVTLVAAPTAERMFSAAGEAWDPAQLGDTLRDYFAGRDPEKNFAASSFTSSFDDRPMNTHWPPGASMASDAASEAPPIDSTIRSNGPSAAAFAGSSPTTATRCAP